MTQALSKVCMFLSAAVLAAALPAAVAEQNASIFSLGSAQAQSPECAGTDLSFQTFLTRFEEGINRFLNGDPGLWKQNALHTDEAMIMGAWGAYEKGWKEVDARYDWAAARFVNSDATVKVEYLSCGMSGNLAYIVAIERSEVHLIGQDKPIAMSLRTNHIFRKEKGEWKLMLRHADPLIDKTAPATVLRK
jgi:ketosteroid isomerase-like protein